MLTDVVHSAAENKGNETETQHQQNQRYTTHKRIYILLLLLLLKYYYKNNMCLQILA